MNHYHLIYIPKGLADMDVRSLPFDRFVCTTELGQGGVHYHCYIETTETVVTVSNRLKSVQNIPAGSKGKKSLHYSNRPVLEHPPTHPEQDLRKFTLGYVQKNENRTFMKGYTEEELKEALDYYNGIIEENKARSAPRSMGPAPVLHEEKPKTDTQVDIWLEYQIELMKPGRPLGIDTFKARAWQFWRKRNHGLFPPRARQQMFLQSIMAHWLHESKQLPEDYCVTLKENNLY